MTAPSLFPELAPVAASTAGPPEKVSADRRRTLRQRADVDRGVHPLMRGPIANNGQTCGSCVHRVLTGHHNRTYPKCDLTEMSFSAASDCRAWWPACPKWALR